MRIDIHDPHRFQSVFQQVANKQLPVRITGIATDSRECQSGDLYIALQGEQVDGHDFIADAAQHGAALALVAHDRPYDDIPTLLVESPLKTVGLVAKAWRQQFSIPLLAITGSNGKTSTKDLLTHLFQPLHTVHATRGNYNTSIGLPLTLLELRSEHTFSIVEMGANQPNDISYLCSICKPNHGLITNIVPAHLEGFGTIEQIARTKGVLFLAVADGIAFVNLTDEWVRKLPIPGEKITYGLTPECDFPADLHTEADGTITLTIDTHEIHTGSPNLTFAKNVIAASAVAITLGLGWETFQRQIRSYRPTPGRCTVQQWNQITIIDDTYNANLTSTLAALDYLTALRGDGRRIFVFGDMFELGKHAATYHHQVGEKCSQLPLDAVFTVGKETVATDQAITRIPYHQHYESKDELSQALLSFLQPEDKVLVKGSRGMAMETIIQALVNS